MIDEDATFRKYGYRSTELGRWSKKPIVVICEKCIQSRECRNDSYRDLCMSCVQIGNTSKKGVIVSDEGRSNMSRAGSLRPPMSAHTKELVVIALTGRSVSEETRHKISESENGKTVSNKTKYKLSESLTGLTQSEETRQRRSAALQGFLMMNGNHLLWTHRIARSLMKRVKSPTARSMGGDVLLPESQKQIT